MAACAGVLGSWCWNTSGDSALGSACLDNLIRRFSSKSTLFLDWDLCFPIGTDFSKCINICVSYQGL